MISHDTSGSTAVARVDIRDRQDVVELVTDFYGRTFVDRLLGPVFVDIAKMDLPAHLPIISDFWETVLFHNRQYTRNALQPHVTLHAKADLTPAHFERWLELWRDTVDDRHVGAKAELAKVQATRIAYSMCRRITGRTSARLEQSIARPDRSSSPRRR